MTETEREDWMEWRLNECAAALREAETRLQNCWNSGQTAGYIREQAELGLTQVRAALTSVGGEVEA